MARVQLPVERARDANGWWSMQSLQTSHHRCAYIASLERGSVTSGVYKNKGKYYGIGQIGGKIFRARMNREIRNFCSK